MWFELVFVILSSAAIKYISLKLDNNINIHQDEPLWDIVHSNTDGEYWKQYVIWIDTLLVLIMVLGGVDILWSHGFNYTIQLLYHCLWLHWIRCIAMCVTHIPCPSYEKRTLISSNKHDLIVSGHALTTALICINTTIFFYPLVAATVIMYGLILLCREHYTVDVVLGLSIGCL